jgi:tetratricopeptide (TPR) repeat protein
MRAFVFTDKSLSTRAGQFVWLSIDTEKAKNAPALRKIKVQAWPSFFVLDPKSEKTVLRWVGGASVAQLNKILDDSRASFHPARSPFEVELAKADRLYGEGNNREAVPAFQKALALASPGWPRYGRTVEQYLFALEVTEDNLTCARVSRDALPKLQGSPSLWSVAASGLGCAVDLPADNPEKRDFIALFEPLTEKLLRDPKIEMSGDDRSGMYQTLIAAREDAKDEAGQKKLTREWSDFLDGEAARAKTPEDRAVYDSHRVSAYLALGEPQRAIPMLEASERDMPADYNPPARQALAYKAMKEYDKALAASDRALKLAYGPRRLGILRTRADIFLGKDEKDSARKVMEQAIAETKALPEGDNTKAQIESLQKKLDSIK